MPDDQSIGHLDRITVKAGKRSGTPCIRGMRITADEVLEYPADGMSAVLQLVRHNAHPIERPVNPHDMFPILGLA